MVKVAREKNKKKFDSQLPKLRVAGSNPVSRFFDELFQALIDLSR